MKRLFGAYMHVGKYSASPQFPFRFRYSVLLSYLLLHCGLLCLSTAVGQCQESLKLPGLLVSDKPDPFNTSAFQVKEGEEETLYPFASYDAGAPPKRKSKEPPTPPAPPDIRYHIDQAKGQISGILGGDQHAEGDVIVKLNDATTGHVATLFAEVVDY